MLSLSARWLTNFGPDYSLTRGRLTLTGSHLGAHEEIPALEKNQRCRHETFFNFFGELECVGHSLATDAHSDV
jgi:hypothetical protein